MKNALKLIGIIAMVAVIGFGMVGCDDDPSGDDGKGNGLPKASGTNAVSGKTYFLSWQRIVFSATADGASNGTYTIGRTVSIDDEPWYELVNGKYKYTDAETGTYTWNEEAKTVTLKPEKVTGNNGTLVGQTAYRQSVQDMIDSFRQRNGQEAVNQQLSSMGFSSEDAYITYAVNEAFKNKTNVYSFSTDNTALFLEVALPANKGINQFSGQTYYGINWDYDDETGENIEQKDENRKYVFASSGNTFTFTQTYNGTVSETITGSYAYDSSWKQVWLRPEKINNKSKAEYYAEQTAYNGHYYENDNAYRAAQTNDAFDFYSRSYNATNKTLGW